MSINPENSSFIPERDTKNNFLEWFGKAAAMVFLVSRVFPDYFRFFFVHLSERDQDTVLENLNDGLRQE